jgi:hypothetical protein
MIIDAHAHLDRYTDRLEEAVAQINRSHILRVGVETFVSPGIRGIARSA